MTVLVPVAINVKTGCKQFWDVIGTETMQRLFVGGPVHGDLLEIENDDACMIVTFEGVKHRYYGINMWTCFGTTARIYYHFEVERAQIRRLIMGTRFAVFFQTDNDAAWPEGMEPP